MSRFLKSLPFALEFVTVLTLAFGTSAVLSVLVALRVMPLHYDGARLVRLLVFETAVLALLIPLLQVRGWTFEKVGLRPTLKGVGVGLLLAAISYVAWFVIFYATAIISPDTWRSIVETRVFTGHFAPLIIVAIGVVNPFFEELFVSGYLMTALKRDEHPWRAINASVALRVLYHLYQGPKGVLSMTPTGLIFGFWYARTGRLWPLMVAHSVIDLVALIALSR